MEFMTRPNDCQSTLNNVAERIKDAKSNSPRLRALEAEAQGYGNYLDAIDK